MSDKQLIIQSHAGPYEVHFDEDPFPALNAAPATAGGGAHFIIDEKVGGLYRRQFEGVLNSQSVLRIEALEENKSLDKFPAYVDHLVGQGIRRDHQLVAIGGGIIQDITCFLAATLLRGVDWSFYPTTLLAQADSCIGSKSSINSGAAKNILGTFTPPRRVTVFSPFLDTLDETDRRSGVGEMIKVQVIDGPDSASAIAADYDRLFEYPDVMAHYIRRSLEIKKGYIEDDEFDRGRRNVFNYGHSFGHAIEAATDFAIPHGIAVTIGMDMANYTGLRLGVGSEDFYRKLKPVLRKNYHGFESHPVPASRFRAAISKDKKNTGSGTVTLILADKGGRVFKDSYANDDAFEGICTDFLESERNS